MSLSVKMQQWVNQQIAKHLARVGFIGGRFDATRLTGSLPVGLGGGVVVDHGALTGLSDDDHGQYQKESEKDQASGYAGLDGSGLVPDARIAATIARDSEVTAAIAAHTDTDASPSAIHHTLGTGANQAAAGNHSHAGAGQYRALVHVNPTATTFDFLADSNGQPITVLRDLE